MTGLVSQYVREVFGRGDGDVEHSMLGVVTGMGLTPDLLPPSAQPARLLLRSEPNAVEVDRDHVVGMALPKQGTLATASGVNLTSSDITEADGYWGEHELVMVDGTQQGQSRRLLTSGSGTLTLVAAFDSDPSASDAFELMPLRVTGAPWSGHDPDSTYYYAVAQISQLGVQGRLSRPVRVEFDAVGDLQGPSPNAVRHLHVVQLASGKFRLLWQYARRGQGAPAAGFVVYSDNGTGTIDYNTPLTDSETGDSVVAYDRAGATYMFNTAGYNDGLAVKFAVVARNTAQLEQLGGGEVSSPVTAMGSPPNPPKGIRRPTAVTQS